MGKQYFHGNIWLHKNVSKCTDLAMAAREERFKSQHKGYTDEQFLDYVRQCAKELGHSPAKVEFIGGAYLARRFQSWANVLIAAGLPKPTKTPNRTGCRIYREEYTRQIALFKAAHKEKIQKTAEKRAACSAQYQEMLPALLERDAAWGAEHEKDTDDELIAYLRQCAEENGATPRLHEVVGGYFILQRFGSWPVVLLCAELPFPKGMSAKAKHIQIYQQRLATRARAEAKTKAKAAAAPPDIA